MLFAQSVFASADIYIYKERNGALTFTTVLTHARYTRVIRSEGRPETNVRSSGAAAKNTVVQLFRDKDTGDIGYLDGDTFIPLWPESYITLTDNNTEFASPGEYKDIWVNGLSEQVGPIKMRQGLPLGVTVTAIDWLIERNLGKYKPRIASKPNQLGGKLFPIVVIISLTSFLVIVVRKRYKNLPTSPLLNREAVFNYASTYHRWLAALLTHCLNDVCSCVVTVFTMIRVAISKHRVTDSCCYYCKQQTQNNTGICDECQMRVDFEKANMREGERQEQEQRSSGDHDSDCETADDNGFDPYRILNVTRGANRDEIKAAYLNLIKQYHPDRVSHLGREFRKLAEEKAQLINRAYQFLMPR